MKVTIEQITNFFNTHPNKIQNIKVLTRFGYKSIEAAAITSKKSLVIKIKTDDGKIIKTSPDHLMLSNGCNWIKTKNLSVGDFLFTGDGPVKIESIKIMSYRKDLYDIQVSDVSEYYGNGLVVHNSAILTDSICFALYGKAYRNINKPALINSINQKKMMVECEFEIGKKNYLIKRGMKPSIFEIWCDGKLVNQDPNSRDYQKILETQILKMNYRAFTQVVVMGSSSYVPFMKLKPNERREFIEDLLDIKIFSIMSKLLTQRIKDSKERYKDIEFEIKSTKEKIELQENFVKTRKQERDTSLEKIKKAITELNEANTEEKNKIRELESQIKLIETDILKFDDIHERLSDLKTKHKKIQSIISDHTNEKDFYSSTAECPTCKQKIDHEHKEHICLAIENLISDKMVDLDEIKIQLLKIQSELEEYNKLNEKIADAQQIIATHNQNIHGNNLVAQKYNKEYQAIENDTTNLEDDRNKLRDMARKVLDLSKMKKGIVEEQQYQAIASLLLQDNGIKAKIIKQYIPIINKQVNKYLNSLDFFCNFNLDENFNEIVKSRYRDEFTYDSFSEGEKLRIDIALIFAWRDVARMKNSVNTNLIIMDEIFDGSLDQAGVDLCINLLYGLKDSNVFVISHRENIADKFSHNIKLSKKNNFTILDTGS